MPSLLSEKNTVFDHGIWDRYAYVQFLRRHKDLASEDFQQREQYEYSLLQDGFYALMDLSTLPVPDNRTVAFWNAVARTNWFAQLQRLYRQDLAGRYVAADTLNRIAKTYVLDPDKCGDDGKDKYREELDELDQYMQSEQEEGDNEDDETPPDAGQNKATQNSAPESGDESAGGAGQAGSAADAPETGQLGLQHGDVDMQDSPEVQDAFVQEATDQHDAINAVGRYMSGPVDHQVEDAAAVTSELDATKIAKFLGFARRAVVGAHHIADATTGELTRYRNRTWSERLHPVDMAGLASGDIRTKARMAEGGLRERQYEDHTPRGRGPVILLRDESGSMSGRKHDNARAMEIALATAFNDDNRDLVSIAWSDGPVRKCVYGQDDVKMHLRRFYGGGTVIYTALELAVKTAADYKDGADILVVTDGDIADKGDSEVFGKAQAFHETNGRIWVVLVDDIRYDLPWADGVITIQDIDDGEKLSELIRTMNRKEISLKGKKVAV